MSNIKLENANALKNSCTPQSIEKLKEVAKEFAALKEVKVVVIGGSVASKVNEQSSDFDIYVYLNEGYGEVPVQARQRIADKFVKKDQKMEINNQFWETGDEWLESTTGAHFDIMYRSPEWITGVVDYSLIEKKANIGYSTCFLHNIKHSIVLYDTDDWFSKLQSRVKTAQYPDELTQAIVRKNYPILRNTFSSYKSQIEKAVGRNDIISINHRLSALFASYFDIIFAVNKVYHPGEKRLENYVERECKLYHQNMKQDIREILHNSVKEPEKLVQSIDKLLDKFDAFLEEIGYKL